MTEHTPLPWRVSEPESSNYALEIVATNARGNEELVCRPPGRRRDANAAFIVEAVNKYEALESALLGLLEAAESELDLSKQSLAFRNCVKRGHDALVGREQQP